jgi:hypothetical protein
MAANDWPIVADPNQELSDSVARSAAIFINWHSNHLPSRKSRRFLIQRADPRKMG